MNKIKVAAAIILSGDKVLAAQRGYGEYKGMWEFPGGKVEPGETSEEALIREIREELESEILIDSQIDSVEYDYPTFHLSMDCFICHLVSANPVLKVHEAFSWLNVKNMENLDWLPADRQLTPKIMKAFAK